MLTVYGIGQKGLVRLQVGPGGPPPSGFMWVDLVSPSREEDHTVQQWLSIEVPTREEMREIEVSSRLYEESGALYMTASVVANSDGPYPETAEITFILSQGKLVTVRYADPRPFSMYLQRVDKQMVSCQGGEQVFMGLIDAIVDRLADLLERAEAEIDEASKLVFRRDPGQKGRPIRTRDFNLIVAQIGRTGDLTSKAHESLVTIARVVTYLAGSDRMAADKLPKDLKLHLKSASRDVSQLTDHATYLTDKISFLLEAVTGLITIQQNDIIKIFSVMSVALMPPTLIASIYGMNFEYMPELTKTWGYPAALLAMACSAVFPFAYFRRRGWL